MEIRVDFDLVLIAIFMTIFITGYIRGGGIELLRVLKVIIPFFVLYFYGDAITNYLFSSERIIDVVYQILPDVPYRNTLAALSTNIFVYIIVYVFLAIFLWRLGKYVLDERIEYIFGRYNSIFGGLFSVVRMYIIISVFIIPFYALNFTNYTDPLTSFILNHPPRFSRLGLLIDKSKPTVDKLNEVTTSLKIMDIKALEKYALLVHDVKDFVIDNENRVYEIHDYLFEKDLIDKHYTKSEFMYYYLNNYRKIKVTDGKILEVHEDLSKTVAEYEQVFFWAYDEKILEMTSDDEIIESFIQWYPTIVDGTDDRLTIEMLTKMKLNMQLYLLLKDWLYDSFKIEVNNGYDLLNDEFLELILNDYSLYEDELIQAIKKIDAKDKEIDDILLQVQRFSKFQEEYIVKYKPQMQIYDKLFDNVSFKYKLTFAIMKDKKFNEIVDYEIDKDSLMYLFCLDSLDFIDSLSGDDETIYYEVAQVYVALFLVDIDSTNQIDKMTIEKLLYQLGKFTSNEDLFNRTKTDLNKIIRSLLIKRNGKTYLEYLIENNFSDADIVREMVNSDEIKEMLTGENYLLLESINKRLLES